MTEIWEKEGGFHLFPFHAFLVQKVRNASLPSGCVYFRGFSEVCHGDLHVSVNLFSFPAWEID